MKNIITFQSFKQLFSLDLRALALLRVSVSLILIFDIIDRFIDFSAFTSSSGVFPLAGMVQYSYNQYSWSIFNITQNNFFTTVFLLIYLICALLFLIGFKTRWMNLFCWIFLVSLQTRYPLINQGGDVALRLILFWSYFLPLGARFSLDQAFDKINIKENSYFSIGTVGFIIQLVALYLFSVSLKSGQEWTTEGSALYYALKLDQFATPLGVWLGQQKFGLLKFLSFLAYYAELFAPILLIVPLKNSYTRFVGVMLLWGLHIGIGLTLAIGNFVYICLTFSSALLPGWVFDSFKDWNNKNLTIYYDEDCGFCLKCIKIVKTFLSLNDSQIKTGQSDDIVFKKMTEMNSWVLKKDGQFYYRSDALYHLMQNSPIFYLFSFLLWPHFMRELASEVYKMIAHRRSRTCEIPIKTKKLNSALQYDLNSYEKCFLIFCIIYVVGWNIVSDSRFNIKWPAKYDSIGLTLRLDQHWAMFAPFPLKEDGWYILKAKLKDNSEFDIWNGPKNLSYEKPKDVRSTYKNFRWRKYMMEMWSSQNQRYRLYFGQYLCRQWNARYRDETKKLYTFDMIYMKEVTPPPQTNILPATVPTVIWTHNCFE